MFYPWQPVSHCVKKRHPDSDLTWMVPNLKVDAHIYHTDNTAAVKKATRDSVAPGINTRTRLGYLDSLMSFSRSCLSLCANFLACLLSMLMPCVGWGLVSEVSLHTGRWGLPYSPCYTEANTSRDAQLHLTKPENNRIVFTLTRHACVKSCKALRLPHYERGFSPTGTAKFLNVSFQSWNWLPLTTQAESLHL